MITQRLLRSEVRQEERLLAKDREETFDLVEPGGACRRVVEMHERILPQPTLHLRCAMRRGVVEDHVQLAMRIGANDLSHESEKVARGVAVGDLMRDLSGRDLQGRVEIDDAVPLVIVSVPLRTPRAQRERRLSPFEGLDRGLLVHAQYDRVL